MVRAHNFLDLLGEKFNRLTVIEEVVGHKVRWNCRCECGQAVIVTTADLKSGHTKSCGCLLSDVTIARNLKSAKHGEGDGSTPEYRAWTGMKARCNNPKHHKYRIYGARGIKVCERWGSFENFLHDMGRKPSAKHSLDRFPNPDGDYAPDNCRWATPLEQRHNRSQKHG